MAGNGVSLVRPQGIVQDSTKILAGSPLAVQGVFLEIIRERFRSDAGIAWTWDEDPTLTDILIEGSFNEETEARSVIPAVYITRHSTTPLKVVLGDRVGAYLPNSLEGFAAEARCAMSIECVSNDQGESSIIADIVQFMLLASSDIIQREFGFKDLTHPVMGQTVPTNGADITKWTTPLTFDVEFTIRWSQIPISPLIQQVCQRVTAHSGANLFRDSVLNSMRRAD